MDRISVFCPATVANVGCGYDVLGFCLDHFGDYMTVSKTVDKSITIIHNDDFGLPELPHENVAGISAHALLDHAKPDCGFKIVIDKRIKPGSGIGSSAASATGSVFAINELLGRPYSKTELVQFAISGESYASKCEHADNLAPAVYGGFTLVKSLNPLKILSLPTPKNLYAVIIHPQIEIKTSDSRGILPKTIPLRKAISQWANVGSLVSALYTDDYNLISESLTDYVVEPHRSKLIPYYDEIKSAANTNGALGCSISGSGPSIFALCKGQTQAEKVENAMRKVLDQTEIKYHSFNSAINQEGIKVITDKNEV